MWGIAVLIDEEHHELVSAFEHFYQGLLDKEERRLWGKGLIYKNSQMNQLFIAFRHGYKYGRSEHKS